MLLTHTPPSYAFGYARRAGESLHPDLWRGLIGAWIPQLGEVGTQLPGLIPLNRRGTFVGAPAWVSTRYGRVLNYPDTASDHISCSHAGQSGVRGTVIIRARVGGAGNRNLCGTFQAGTFCSLRVASAGGLQYNLGTSGATNTGHTPTAGVWEHYAMTFNAGSWRVLVDGSIPFSGSYPGSPIDMTDADWFIAGQVGSGAWFNGDIAEHYMYDRVLTDGEIHRLYVDGLAPFRLAAPLPVVVSAGVAALAPNVSDAITLGEVATLLLPILHIVTVDALTVGEVPGVTLVSDTLTINRTEAVTVGEAVTMHLRMFLSVVDALTIGDTPDVTLVTFSPTLTIDVTDALTVADDLRSMRVGRAPGGRGLLTLLIGR